MNWSWVCCECKKEYPENCEGLVVKTYPYNKSYLAMTCTCGGMVDLCPTLRATDAEESAPSQAVSNTETLSNSDGW